LWWEAQQHPCRLQRLPFGRLPACCSCSPHVCWCWW
jgi:hypothetical protein